MSATTTLVHTSSRETSNAQRIARVLAAGRIADARKAAQAEREAGIAHNRVLAQAWVDSILAEGAVEVGTKVCLSDGGKWRPLLETFAAADSIARWVADGDEV